jgi:hypothetical protein
MRLLIRFYGLKAKVKCSDHTANMSPGTMNFKVIYFVTRIFILPYFHPHRTHVFVLNIVLRKVLVS